jgi:hypothetical protein
MIDDDVRRAIDAWVDGAPSADDEQTLSRALGADPAAIALLADRARLHALLRDTGGWGEPPPAPVGSRRVFGRRLAWGGAALVAGGAGLWLTLPPTADAGAIDAVQGALMASRPAGDRRYSVSVGAARQWRFSAARRSAVPASTLWVRGSRFVQIADVSGRPVAWGRDGTGAVWFAPSRDTAALFDAAEVPEALAEVCDLRSLDLPTLLEKLLADFDLQRLDRGDGHDLVRATPRAGAVTAYGRVDIEIERESLVVRRAVVERSAGRWHGIVVAFTLEEIGVQDDGVYEMAAHVAAGATVLGRDSPRGARGELLREYLQAVRHPEGSR